MKSLSGHHPGAVCVYFLLVELPLVLGINPWVAGGGLAAGMLFWGLTDQHFSLRGVLFYLALPLLSALVNPVFNHNGVTVLFFFNSNPVTREAVVCGGVLGLVISATLVWARCFTTLMDTDRLLCVTGALSPGLSLTISMALRYVPLLRRQGSRIREAHRAAGLLREDNAPDRIRGALRVFSGLSTWALENGIITADSMTARGYGTSRRTRYRLFPWERRDTALLLLSILLGGAALFACFRGRVSYIWYPVLTSPDPGAEGIGGILAFLLLSLAGPMMEIADRLRWRGRRRDG